ncbi:MarR family winged helix-turn-helix transcriptional regulator [Clostridium beijerinckii]|uniref:MarR family winged helix-turn-helix transcriptional regulator n=1 Tax=Clostridium beijerinckii TaxID=1520 RepID=UPI00098C6445|nr:MarR family transcriptional regulator [Clostridium beijerinckii]MBA8935139.1 DNA-binding MarR family transcriptional regulator [Clostridium beijerinckii]NRT34746.1 DNA-binding MarR family transcriptional regulator [Clostridium beijerinckii]NRT45825.1 DNA-binding MarR family transcriptional regulator [Clostridium beijerinckii]NRT71358.1 DNA-binding MarR family transcriptional regulator [Clostridium beijerinckii]NRU39536.1 DNA-binding MarR family transcriptional regulator [Clostridium beijeri
MITDEILSTTFNNVSEIHNLIKKTAERNFLTEYTFTEVHCIEQIEKMEDPNVTKLSKNFEMTRGALSKIIKKLIEKGAVEIYRKPENKKEIYYKLTESGMSTFMEHEEMHRSRLERDKVIFSKLSEDEKATFVSILDKIHEQLTTELKNVSMDEHI